MVQVFPFRAVRPRPGAAPAVAAVPYDVVSAGEAREIIRANPASFLTVSRADALLPSVPPDDDRVYREAGRRFREMMAEGLLLQDDGPSLYLYRVSHGGEEVTGVVCTIGVDEYTDGNIRRHELTRYDKEQDRTRHIDAVNAQTGLVFLFYRDPGTIAAQVEASPAMDGEPVAVVTAPTGAVHRVIRVTDPAERDRLARLFAPASRLYIADGHHRAASAVNVARARRAEGRATEESDRFMAVIFPHDRIRIHGYSRLITDLAGRTPAAFLEDVRRKFRVHPCGPVDGTSYQVPPRAGQPPAEDVFHLYLDHTWYELVRPRGTGAGAETRLDVQVLQEEILEKLLGIRDPRADPRLQYLGGARPLSELVEKVDRGEFALAIAMQPASIGTVMAIADAGGVMPPKSTWFEPKLLSGLLTHTLG